MSEIYPWRSKDKNTDIPETQRNEKIPKYINKKQRRYMFHHVHGPNTWMVDYFFFKADGGVVEPAETVNDDDTPQEEERKRRKSNLITVLALMHCNSRLFIPTIVPNRQSEAFIDILYRHFFGEHAFCRMDVLISDYEPSFGKDVIIKDGRYIIDPSDKSNRSVEMSQALANNHVQHIGYNISKTDEHTKLALIDRMARTLRDMIYNCRMRDPDFALNKETLDKLTVAYNLSPHATLSSLMGFPVTPIQVYNHDELQHEIIKKLVQSNYHTAWQINRESLGVGDTVWVHNPRVWTQKRRNTVEDHPYTIESVTGIGGYRIKNKYTGDIKHVSRMQIVPHR